MVRTPPRALPTVGRPEGDNGYHPVALGDLSILQHLTRLRAGQEPLPGRFPYFTGRLGVSRLHYFIGGPGRHDLLLNTENLFTRLSTTKGKREERARQC